MSFLQPDNWAIVEMLELDNNCRNWIQKKNKDLQFQFNEGTYNLFQIDQDTKQKIPPIYRSGRLVKFYFDEGNPNPKDMRINDIEGTPQTNNLMKKLDISRWFLSDMSGLENFLQKYGSIIFFIIGLIIGFIVKNCPKCPT